LGASLPFQDDTRRITLWVLPARSLKKTLGAHLQAAFTFHLSKAEEEVLIMEKDNLWLSLLTLGVAFSLAACTPALTKEEKPTPTFTVTPTSWAPGSHDTPAPASTPTSSCPEVDIVYRLDYIHEVVQNMPNANFKHIAEPDAAFFLTFHGDGTVDSDDFENLVTVSITGTFEDCVLEGNAELSADIFGLCAEGIAKLHITEHWEAVSTTVTCPDQEPQSISIEGFFSAPEDQFDFKLKEEGDTQVLEGDMGILSVYYSWTLHEYGLAIVPLSQD
jgi:hypothetical protein